VIVPLVAAFALFVGIAASWWRHPPSPASRSGRPPLRCLVALVVGGYAAFLVIVLVFHVWVTGQRGVLQSAVTGGAFLGFSALPTFLLLSWIEDRRSRAGPRRRRWSNPRSTQVEERWGAGRPAFAEESPKARGFRDGDPTPSVPAPLPGPHEDP
jgi:uncharacterized protein DUF6256